MPTAADMARAFAADPALYGVYRDWLQEAGRWDWPHVLAAVLSHPAADGPRLLAADWFEENGQPERAEFIRAQLKLARFGPRSAARLYHEQQERAGEACEVVGCDYCALRLRGRALLREHWTRWYTPIPGRANDCGNLLPNGTGHPAHTFRRGFVAEITLTCADWLAHADALRASCPIERVVLIDKCPVKSEGFEDYRWAGAVRRSDLSYSWCLPPTLFDQLLPDPRCLLVRDGTFVSVRGYGSEADALDALSRACLALPGATAGGG